MAEIEFSVFSRQCLHRRLGHGQTLEREVAALESHRNQAQAAIRWRFTTTNARKRLQHVYPAIHQFHLD